MNSYFIQFENLTGFLNPSDVRTFRASTQLDDTSQMILTLKLLVRNIAHNELIVDSDTSAALLRATDSHNMSGDHIHVLRTLALTICDQLDKIYQEDYYLLDGILSGIK